VARGRTTATPAPRIWRGGVEKALRLDAAALIRSCREQHVEVWRRWQATGGAVSLPVLAPLTRGAAPAGHVALRVELDGVHGAAAFPDGASAPLFAVPANINGVQWRFRCPRLSHACAALFKPDGGGDFASRQAHGLAYRSLSERPAERAARKARKLRARLGEHPTVLGGRLPDMPLRMREGTYLRLCGEIIEAEERALAASVRLLARIAAAGA
jgi:hypothetical protein